MIFVHLSVDLRVRLWNVAEQEAVRVFAANLGDLLANAAYEALQGARMRVLPKHLDWVVKLIGQDRAALCESLPRYVRSALQTEISAVGKS